MGEWRESGGVEGEWRESGGRVEGEWRGSGGVGEWRESGGEYTLHLPEASREEVASNATVTVGPL